MQSLDELQKVAAEQPGYLGSHNELKENNKHFELINAFAFETPWALKKWQNLDDRKKCLDKLDKHPQGATLVTEINELASLVTPRSAIRKHETVAILIFWIFLLSKVSQYISNFVFPPSFSPTLLSFIIIACNVLLISYVFLPWSINLLEKIKFLFVRQN